jgi:hypothetical protein
MQKIENVYRYEISCKTLVNTQQNFSVRLLEATTQSSDRLRELGFCFSEFESPTFRVTTRVAK